MSDQARQTASAEDIRVAIETVLRQRYDDDVLVFTDEAPDGFSGRDASAYVMHGHAASRGSDDEKALRLLGALTGICIDDNGTVTDPAVELERVIADRDAQVTEYDALLKRQSQIMTGVANALRGVPPPLTQHSHHDLAERAAAVVAERDALSVEVLALRARVAELEAAVGPAEKPPIIPAKFAKRLAPYVVIHAEENADGTVSLARTALGERKFYASVTAANVRATVISSLLSVLRDARRSGHEDAEATIDAINRVDVLFDALWPEVQP